MMKFFNNIIVKSFVLTLIPLIYPSLFFYALNLNDSVESKDEYIGVSIVLGLLHIIALIYYGCREKKSKDELSRLKTFMGKAPNEMDSLTPLLQKYSKVIHDNANKLYEVVRMKKGHSDIEDWQWMEAKGDEICNELYVFITKVAEEGKSFAVNMMFRKMEHGVPGFTMLSRASDDAAHTPRCYRNFVSEEKAGEVYYRQLMDQNPTRPEVLINKKEIEEKFVDVDDVKYSQYIAMTISCGGKAIGLLQIVAYDGSVISNSKDEILRLCNNYFSIAVNAMLLTDKNENINQMLR